MKGNIRGSRRKEYGYKEGKAFHIKNQNNLKMKWHQKMEKKKLPSTTDVYVWGAQELCHLFPGASRWEHQRDPFVMEAQLDRQPSELAQAQALNTGWGLIVQRWGWG